MPNLLIKIALVFILIFYGNAYTLKAQRLKWHHVLRGAEVHDFKSDAAGNIYLIAMNRFSNPIYFNDSLWYKPGGIHRLLLKISPDGKLEWHKKLDGVFRHQFLQFDKNQNIVVSCHNGAQLIVEKFNPQGEQIFKTEIKVENPKPGGMHAYSFEIFLHGFAVFDDSFYFLVYSGENTSVEGINLIDNKHYLIKADHRGKIEWVTKVSLESAKYEKGYLAAEPDGNLLVTMSPLSLNGAWYRNISRIYRVSPDGVIIQDKRFPEFRRYTAFRYVGISPGGKICVAASVDSQAVIKGKVYNGHTLAQMHLNNDLSINKYVTAKGLVINVTSAIDADDNFYTFGASTGYGSGNPYLPAPRGTTFGDTTINQDAGFNVPRTFFAKTDTSGKPIIIRRLGKLGNWAWDDIRLIKPGWAIVSNCRQVYIGATFWDTLKFDNAAIIPDKRTSLYYNFIIASLENNPDSIETQLQPLCNKALACKTIANKGFNTFNWDFGDGQSSATESPVHTYSSAGTYVVTLRCSTPLGCEKIITDTVYVPDVIKANFSFQSNSGCQWVGFHFKDSSITDTINNVTGQSWRWDFGDGSTDTARNPVHIYTKSGNYTVRLIYSNGFCSDTFTTTQNITILEAPKPGFTVSVTKGCTPLQVELKDKSDGTAIKYFYDFGNSETDTVASPSVVYTKPGIYKIKQELLGGTGCITSDSVFIYVIQGISSQDAPKLEYASVTAKNAIEITWQPLFGADKYFVYRNYEGSSSSTFKLIAETNNTTFTDTLINPSEASFIYKIIAKDSCGNLGKESNIGKTILLKAKNENNKFALLQWTPYEDWQQYGVVANYIIEAIDSADHFTEIAKLNSSNAAYSDDNFWNKEKQQRCYRIKAISNADAKTQSSSNIICLPYIPQLWIPTAFSPNDDGLNDTFRILSTGITEMELQIFNRWGERICILNNANDGWDGKYKGEKVSAGEYIYVLKAKGTDQQKIYTTGSIMILR